MDGYGFPAVPLRQMIFRSPGPTQTTLRTEAGRKPLDFHPLPQKGSHCLHEMLVETSPGCQTWRRSCVNCGPVERPRGGWSRSTAGVPIHGRADAHSRPCRIVPSTVIAKRHFIFCRRVSVRSCQWKCSVHCIGEVVTIGCSRPSCTTRPEGGLREYSVRPGVPGTRVAGWAAR